MVQAGRPHTFFLRGGCSHLACFLNSFLNRNLFVCLCTASTLFIWLSVLWQLAKLFRTTLRAAQTTCVWRLSHIKLQAFYSNWLSFPAVVRPVVKLPPRRFRPTSRLSSIPRVQACGQWCHVMLYNYVLLHVKCHKTHAHCEGGVGIFL